MAKLKLRRRALDGGGRRRGGPSLPHDEVACRACQKGVVGAGAKMRPEVLILADSGGSNGCQPRNWKRQLQEQIADRFGLSVTVCHYPTGASKWNPIERRLFSEVSKTIAGVPLVSFDLLLGLIRQTKTTRGLHVQARLVETVYEKGIVVTDDEMAALALEKHATFPRWNYTIRPRESGSNK